MYYNNDGMLIVEGNFDRKILYLDEYLKGTYGIDQIYMRSNLIHEFDGDEDLIEEVMNKIEEEFYNYCEDNDLDGEVV